MDDKSKEHSLNERKGRFKVYTYPFICLVQIIKMTSKGLQTTMHTVTEIVKSDKHIPFVYLIKQVYYILYI